MSTMIQIRNVPADVHRQVKARAALAGMSMSEFILRELRKSIARPTREELLASVLRLPKLELDPSPADLLRAERARHFLAQNLGSTA
jgi:antitoxin FitA